MQDACGTTSAEQLGDSAPTLTSPKMLQSQKKSKSFLTIATGSYSVASPTATPHGTSQRSVSLVCDIDLCKACHLSNLSLQYCRPNVMWAPLGKQKGLRPSDRQPEAKVKGQACTEISTLQKWIAKPAVLKAIAWKQLCTAVPPSGTMVQIAARLDTSPFWQ